jgi:3-oxoacyl-[acyl-carrier protein] reductase
LFTPLTGRTVLVTGGTKGIGKGIAGVFAQAGANVVVAGRDADTGRRAAQELGARYVQADISRAEECERMAAEAGDVDVLCANAGIFPDVKLADMTEADIDGIFATNVKGTMLSVKACLPALERSGHGRVIVTSSITGPITGFPGWSHYGATKAAQLGFIRTAAIELAAKGITINAVLPGNVVTEGLAPTTGRRWRPRSRSASSARCRTSASPPCSSPPTRPATSPARRSWSTAARCSRSR